MMILAPAMSGTTNPLVPFQLIQHLQKWGGICFVFDYLTEDLELLGPPPPPLYNSFRKAEAQTTGEDEDPNTETSEEPDGEEKERQEDAASRGTRQSVSTLTFFGWVGQREQDPSVWGRRTRQPAPPF